MCTSWHAIYAFDVMQEKGEMEMTVRMKILLGICCVTLTLKMEMKKIHGM